LLNSSGELPKWYSSDRQRAVHVERELLEVVQVTIVKYFSKFATDDWDVHISGLFVEPRVAAFMFWGYLCWKNGKVSMENACGNMPWASWQFAGGFPGEVPQYGPKEGMESMDCPGPTTPWAHGWDPWGLAHGAGHWTRFPGYGRQVSAKTHPGKT
jgi:hypothetical protein